MMGVDYLLVPVVDPVVPLEKNKDLRGKKRKRTIKTI
tara:strand:+ start:53 stop:163 length:111 start_codon:yes stop_codon:yes gene_type:complete